MTCHFADDIPLPERFPDECSLDEYMAMPTRHLATDLAGIDGDFMVLGAGGKMGPALARLARNAAPGRRVYAVARFTEAGLALDLEKYGVIPISCDLLDHAAVQRLPECRNIIFMAGRKFGTGPELSQMWAVNALVPAFVAERFASARMAVFSTACVYPFVPVAGSGASEGDELRPPGEYANSCIARERIFEHYSRLHGIAGRTLRLSYAIDLRYGVLTDIALHVLNGRPIDVSMGHVNVIWQGDANEQALRSLAVATAPMSPLNISGDRHVSVRWLGEEFARILGRPVSFTGSEAQTAWLVDTREAQRLFGPPRISLDRQVAWVADWVCRGQRLYMKPTRFEVRDGSY